MRRPGASVLLIGLCSAAILAGCGSSTAQKPLGYVSLESLLTVESFPIYWLGIHFEGMALTSANEDPGGAFTLQYGNCLSGGPSTCRTALELITSPRSSFLPSAGSGTKPVKIRGVSGLAAQRGAVIELRTGSVVVDVRAIKRPLAQAAAASIVAMNAPGAPGQALPQPTAGSTFSEQELPGQQPATVHLLPPIPPASGSKSPNGSS